MIRKLFDEILKTGHQKCLKETNLRACNGNIFDQQKEIHPVTVNRPMWSLVKRNPVLNRRAQTQESIRKHTSQS